MSEMRLGSCKLCGKPAEVFTMHGVPITSCSCVEQYPGRPAMVAVQDIVTVAVEHIIEAIYAQENRGALRKSLVILCGKRAAETIGHEMEQDGRLTHRTTEARPRYPVIESIIPRATLERAWRGEILGVPVLFDADCPVDYWRVERVPDWIGMKMSIGLIPYPGGASVSIVGGAAPILTDDSGKRYPKLEQFVAKLAEEFRPTKEQYQQMIDEAYADAWRAAGGSSWLDLDDIRGEVGRKLVPHAKHSGEPWAETKEWRREYLGQWAPTDEPRVADTGVNVVKVIDEWDVNAKGELSLPVYGPERQRSTREMLEANEKIDGMPCIAIVSHFDNRGRDDAWYRPPQLTPAQEAFGRAYWAERLRELQAEARRKEREQVVVDLDWD